MVIYRVFPSFLVVALLSLIALPVNAITIDELKGTQILSVYSSGSTDSSIVESNGSLGGFRSIEIASTSEGILTVVAGEGSFDHSQSSKNTGWSRLVWDGDNHVGLTSYSGLGGVDFSEDNASGIRIIVEFFDYPAEQPIDLVFTIYDATDPSGNKWSQAQRILDEKILTPTELNVSFAEFNTHGPAGGADISKVGAFALLVNGVNQGSNLLLSFVGTNGECTHVPVDGNIIDLCGDCGGNNACLDCEGQAYGPNGPGTMCDTGFYGVCKDGLYDENCICVQQVQSSEESCDGLDNNCDGQVDEILDECGVCGGDNSSCAGCDGIANSGLELDVCGVCGGDGASCNYGADNCKEVNIGQEKALLDRDLFTLRDIYGRSLRRYLRATNYDKKAARMVSRKLKKISFRYNKLHLEFSTSLPGVLLTCPGTIQSCETKDIGETLDDLKASARSWRRGTKRMVGKTLALGVGTPTDKKRKKRAKKYNDLVNSYIEAIPRSYTNCS